MRKNLTIHFDERAKTPRLNWIVVACLLLLIVSVAIIGTLAGVFAGIKFGLAVGGIYVLTFTIAYLWMRLRTKPPT